MSSGLKNFLDQEGRLRQWPAKRALQLEAIAYIAEHFIEGSIYNEAQLNEEIKKLHTFGDWAILRREMCEEGHFIRNRDGSVYRRTKR